MAILERSFTEEFERLQAAGQAAFEQGRLRESVELLGHALELAEEHGDRRCRDLALCNLASARIGLDDRTPLEPRVMNRLREILLRNEDATNCRLAAYNLARAYEIGKEIRKGLFYARLALERSQLLGREDWVASAHNQIGNLLLAQSFFDAAGKEYDAALELLDPADEAVRRALIGLNVGYSHVVNGELRHGFTLLYRSLRTLRRHGVPRGEMFAHIDLSYAHLEAGRYRSAIVHASKGLSMAERQGEAEAQKNALYLLGEARHLSGDDAQARRCFERLGQQFYPGSSGIPEFLLAVDVRKMISLRA